MTALTEDNIVVRALLSEPGSSAEQLDACATKPSVKRKSRRAGLAGQRVENRCMGIMRGVRGFTRLRVR